MIKTISDALRQFICLLALVWLLAATEYAEKLPLKIYGAADGMASSAVFQIARDSRGFLWFSTRDGLSRFDGREFVVYQLEKRAGAAIFYAVFEAADGTFWISANDGLYRAERNASSLVEPESPSASASRYKILRAAKVETLDDVKTETEKWLGVYNRHRLHDSLSQSNADRISTKIQPGNCNLKWGKYGSFTGAKQQLSNLPR